MRRPLFSVRIFFRSFFDSRRSQLCVFCVCMAHSRFSFICCGFSLSFLVAHCNFTLNQNHGISREKKLLNIDQPNGLVIQFLASYLKQMCGEHLRMFAVCSRFHFNATLLKWMIPNHFPYPKFYYKKMAVVFLCFETFFFLSIDQNHELGALMLK